MLSHHTWSPRAPLINVVAQCMPASEPKWLFFLKAFRSKAMSQHWIGGKGACKSLRNEFDRMAVFFEEPGLSPGKIFWFTDVQTQAWTNYLLHLPQPQSKHTLIFKAATQQTKKHIFFCSWLCKRKLEQIPFCTCHNPNPKTRSSSQLLPTNKECASTPPEAEFHKLCFAQCTYSARTVHGTVHARVHGHKKL